MHVTRHILIISLAALTNACSFSVLPDNKIEYKKQRVAAADLEIPPDLTSSTIGDMMPVTADKNSATYSEYQSVRNSGRQTLGSTEVLPEVPNVKILRDGNQRWLEIQATPEQVWTKLIAFWNDNGVILIEKNPATGMMKTDWLEQRPNIQENFITDFLRKALDTLYSSATRDQFRIRLEPGIEPNTTDVYLTQRGLEEQMTTSIGGDKQDGHWVNRPNDPGLEAEMLRRIMMYFGTTEQQAAANLANTNNLSPARSELKVTADGKSALLVKAGLESTWRLVGIALERVGFSVEDRDRSAWLYYVRYDDPNKATKEGGFFSNLAFWRDATPKDNSQYRLHLEASEDITQVSVQNHQGQPEISETATRILTLLKEQIH